MTQPDGTTWGLGDLVYTAFFSPAKAGALIWGAGPSVVLLGMPGRMVIGVLANNIWSYAGSSDRDDVNQMLIQYFGAVLLQRHHVRKAEAKG